MIDWKNIDNLRIEGIDEVRVIRIVNKFIGEIRDCDDRVGYLN